MTQVEIEQLILENGFKLESKEGHITYEFGTGDIYRISQLLFKKMDYIPCCTELKVANTEKINKLNNALKNIEEDEDFRLDDGMEWVKQKSFIEGKINALTNL